MFKVKVGNSELRILVDKAPRPSISDVIWILSFDTGTSETMIDMVAYMRGGMMAR